ncbi:hypothetical protein, partial [Rhodoplanes sp. SY1]|uniref:hypothetical protein n=1 Tax=Rhodoplanes sp. SY1 TaxID=3166646 RepID=UPI0038B61D6A
MLELGGKVVVDEQNVHRVERARCRMPHKLRYNCDYPVTGICIGGSRARDGRARRAHGSGKGVAP